MSKTKLPADVRAYLARIGRKGGKAADPADKAAAGRKGGLARARNAAVHGRPAAAGKDDGHDQET